MSELKVIEDIFYLVEIGPGDKILFDNEKDAIARLKERFETAEQVKVIKVDTTLKTWKPTLKAQAFVEDDDEGEDEGEGEE